MANYSELKDWSPHDKKAEIKSTIRREIVSLAGYIPDVPQVIA